MLGKRKRDTQVVSRSKNGSNASSSPPLANIDAGDVFRRHFEAMFIPLPESKSEQTMESEDEQSDDASEVSEWSGLSESDNDLPIVEVVDYATVQNGEDSDEFHRARQKAFMVRLARLILALDDLLIQLQLYSQVDLHAKRMSSRTGMDTTNRNLLLQAKTT